MNYINFFSDRLCKESAFQAFCGVCGFTGDLANLSNWAALTTHPEYTTYIKYISASDTGYAISDTQPNSLFDLAFSTSAIYDGHTVLHDTQTNGGSAYDNAFYISTIHGDVPYSVYLRLYAVMGGLSGNDAIVKCQLGVYEQTPWDDTRQTWNYSTVSRGNTAGFSAEISIETPQTSQFAQIKLYKCVIQEKEFYCLVFGVNAAGVISPTNPAAFVLIPTVNFIDRIPKPYVGPVSKESAQAAFAGDRYADSVLPRDLTGQTNPYGFNNGDVYLTEITREQYYKIVNALYNGFSGNILNKAGQVITEIASTAGIVDGNAHRPRDEIETMIGGIICCHAVPQMGGFASTGLVGVSSICGYHLFNTDTAPQLKCIDSFQTETIDCGIISRQTGNYLDFSPYTTCILSIPILGDIEIEPSALLGNHLSLHFNMDVFSGILSCDICITYTSGKFAGVQWIYATMQGGCSCDFPIVGAGANANPLLKIAGSIAGVATGGASKLPTAVYNVYDAVQSAAYSTPVKRSGNTNAGVLLSPYKIYLTVTTPNNSNAADFWNLAGIPSHMSGTVGDFSGYTVFEHVDLSGVSGATESELAEIESALYGGVWL